MKHSMKQVNKGFYLSYLSIGFLIALGAGTANALELNAGHATQPKIDLQFDVQPQKEPQEFTVQFDNVLGVDVASGSKFQEAIQSSDHSMIPGNKQFVMVRSYKTVKGQKVYSAVLFPLDRDLGQASEVCASNIRASLQARHLRSILWKLGLNSNGPGVNADKFEATTLPLAANEDSPYSYHLVTKIRRCNFELRNSD